jgi:hypothetical protein
MSEINKQHPLILVFYLDRALMSNPEIIGPFAEHVNQTIALREANAMAFFLPTDGEERIECINPVQIEPAKMDKIMKMVDHIAENFLDIGQGADDGKEDPNNEIEIPDDNE